jgi:hypothetical protein
MNNNLTGIGFRIRFGIEKESINVFFMING